jgi:hypothetical protein
MQTSIVWLVFYRTWSLYHKAKWRDSHNPPHKPQWRYSHHPPYHPIKLSDAIIITHPTTP